MSKSLLFEYMQVVDIKICRGFSLSYVKSLNSKWNPFLLHFNFVMKTISLNLKFEDMHKTLVIDGVIKVS